MGRTWSFALFVSLACAFFWVGQIMADEIDGIKISLDLSGMQVTGKITYLTYSYGYEEIDAVVLGSFNDPIPWSGFKVAVTGDNRSCHGPSKALGTIELFASQPRKTWWIRIAGNLSGSIFLPFTISSKDYPLQIVGQLGESVVAWIECDKGKCNYQCDGGTCTMDVPENAFTYEMRLSSLTNTDFADTNFVIKMTANGPLYYPVSAPSALILFGSGSAFLLCPFLRDLIMRFQRRRG